MLWALATVLLWSGAGYSSARCARNWGTATANRMRLGLASVLLCGLCLLLGTLPLYSASWWYLGAGVLHLGLGDLCLFAAYRLIGPRLGVLVCGTLGIPVALLLEWVILGNVPPAVALVLVVGVIAGVIIAFAPAERLRLGDRSVRLGLLMGTLAALGQGGSQAVQRVGAAKMAELGLSMDAFAGALCRSSGGLAVLLVMWGVTGALRHRGDVAASYGSSTTRLDGQTGRRVWPWLLVSTGFGPILGIGALTLALESTEAVLVQAVIATLPVWMIPWAWVLDGDRPSLRSLLGGALAVGCVAGMVWLR